MRAKTIGAVSRRVAYRVGWKATKGRNVHDFSADISMDTWATAEYLAPWFVNVRLAANSRHWLPLPTCHPIYPCRLLLTTQQVAQSAKQDGAKDVKDLITIAGI